MRLSFFGANSEVTGSCHYIDACGKKILIDCGMKQGGDSDNENESFPFAAADIDYVLLTHAHIDHSGRLPLLYKQGFKGTIITTNATFDLCQIMLRDSAHIQESEAEWKNRKGMRAGRPPVEPLYDMSDAEGVLQLFSGCEYNEKITVCHGITAEFVDVGHLLGSASIIVEIEEAGEKRRIVFSGDIGNTNKPIIEDPSYIDKADYVVMESTYGDRSHEDEDEDYVHTLAEITENTFKKGGNLVIPSFAVGRTQELLYFYRKIKELGLVKSNPDFSVYVDSPLAVEATLVFKNNIAGYFDDEAMELVRTGINPLSFNGLKTSVSVEDSRAINFENEPKVIISASGMCDAGRIKHHLKHNLWRPESTILFVGYQANGTLGRALLEGAKSIKIFGEEIEVEAEILQMNSMSSHADREGLVKWVTSFKEKPDKVFIVHGDADASKALAEKLCCEYGFNAVVPNFKSEYDLIDGKCLEAGLAKLPKMELNKKTANIFAALVGAVERLMGIANSYKVRTNKEMVKFTGEINKLCDKWEDK